MFNRTGYRYKQTIATVKQYYLEKIVVKYCILSLDTPFIPIFRWNENIRLGKETNPFLHETFYYLLENNVQNWNNLL